MEEDLLRLFPSRGLSYHELRLALPIVLARNPELITSGKGALWEGVRLSVERLSPEELRSLVSEVGRGIRERKVLEVLFSLLEGLPDEVVGDLRAIIGVLAGRSVAIPEKVSLPRWAGNELIKLAEEGNGDAVVLLSRAEMDREILTSVIYALPTIVKGGADWEVLGGILSRLSPEDVVSVLQRMGDLEATCKVMTLYGADKVVPHLSTGLALSLLKVCDGEVRSLIVRSIPTEELHNKVDLLLREEMYDVIGSILPSLPDGEVVKVIQKAPRLFYGALREGKVRPTFRLARRIVRLAHEAGPLNPTWIGPLEAILEADPSLTVRTDGWGNGLLHYAALYPHVGVVKLLIRRGAGVLLNVPNRAGYTPLSLAIRSGGWEVVEYLKSLGAKP